MARGGMNKAAYWAARRSKQWNRFGGKLGKVYQKPSTSSVAQAAWSGVKYLRTLVNSETHKIDNAVTSAISSTGTVTHLTNIAQDDTISGRTGNSVLVTYLAVKSYISINGSATSSFVRFILFIDRQQIADTTPAVTDVLTSASPTSFYNANTVGRFQILYDNLFRVNTNGPQSHVLVKTFKIDKHVRFNGAANTDQQKGAIYYLCVSNEATNTATQESRFRVGWHDN